jgi:protoporphyrinogen oxidase
LQALKKRIGIVGGGILGMTLALRLSQAGFDITLFEASPELGGLVRPMQIGSYTWDRFYHVILMSDTNTLSLLDELGLKDKVQWGTTKTGFYTDGELYSMSNAIEFLTFPPLGLVDKLRLGASIFYASRIRDWERLEGVSVSDWLIKLSGKTTFNKVWLPLLKCKLGENYKITNAAFIWATIARMYAARKAGLKQEMFGYVAEGYSTVLGRFEEALKKQGVKAVVGTPVRSVNKGKGLEVETNAETAGFDSIILTTPCGGSAEICTSLADAERERLSSVTYQGVICASYILKKPLGGYYITNITEDWVPFTAVIEMTALVDKGNFGGHSMVYLPLYVDKADPLWGQSDDRVNQVFFPALQRMYPALSQNDVVAFAVCRAEDVMPVTTLNYSKELLPQTQTSMKNVFIVNSAQIPNGTMNVNELVKLANRKSVEIASLLKN